MIRKNCLVCESEKLKQIIDLGNQPFADTFVPESRLGDSDAVYPLVCTLCEECGQIQTKYETDPNKRYSHIDYSYTSSNSKFSRDHWDKYAQEIAHSLNLKPSSFIVEIGSNDGYLIEHFIKQGHRGTGVDPSPYMAELAKQRNVETFVGLFGPSSVDALKKSHGNAQLIMANNVFNHADNPLEFARSVANLLSSQGSFVFEQPYWTTAFRAGSFDQIYHEHVSYFTVKSLKALLKRAGLSIYSVEVVDYHGGSLRIIARHSAEVSQEPKTVAEMISEEERLGVFSVEAYKNYMQENLKRRSAFLQKVYRLKDEGNSIIAVGAAAKGNTFLNFYKLDHSLIDYVTDASPHKKGKYTPFTRIPIVGDEIFAQYDSPYALILSWNIANQLKEKLEIYNKKIQFLVP